MRVDTTLLMYGVFQSCRHALRHTSTALNLLSETLEFIKQQGTLVVEVPDKGVEENAIQSIVVVPSAEPDQADLLCPANQALFSLIYVGTSELQRLWAAGSKSAVRSLGYAFHMLPPLLRTPDQFSPRQYMCCFGDVRHHWNELSPEMRRTFCDVLGLDLAEVTALDNSADHLEGQ
jgi:hypothetical protein